MALLVAQGLIESNNFEATVAAIGDNFIHDINDTLYGWSARYRAPGKACMNGIKKVILTHPLNRNDNQAALFPNAGGSGAVMRAYPCGIKYSNNVSLAKDYALAQGNITHYSWCFNFTSCMRSISRRNCSHHGKQIYRIYRAPNASRSKQL